MLASLSLIIFFFSTAHSTLVDLNCGVGMVDFRTQIVDCQFICCCILLGTKSLLSTTGTLATHDVYIYIYIYIYIYMYVHLYVCRYVYKKNIYTHTHLYKEAKTHTAAPKLGFLPALPSRTSPPPPHALLPTAPPWPLSQSSPLSLLCFLCQSAPPLSRLRLPRSPPEITPPALAFTVLRPKSTYTGNCLLK